jgi:hypothetical protein
MLKLPSLDANSDFFSMSSGISTHKIFIPGATSTFIFFEISLLKSFPTAPLCISFGVQSLSVVQLTGFTHSEFPFSLLLKSLPFLFYKFAIRGYNRFATVNFQSLNF